MRVLVCLIPLSHLDLLQFADSDVSSLDHTISGFSNLDGSRLWQYGECVECFLCRVGGLVDLGFEPFDGDLCGRGADLCGVWDVGLGFVGGEEGGEGEVRKA